MRHSTDVGLCSPCIVRMLQGEYVAPEKIENVYSRSPFIAQVFVYGNSYHSQLVALVVPDAEMLLPWAAQRCGQPSACACSRPAWYSS